MWVLNICRIIFISEIVGCRYFMRHLIGEKLCDNSSLVHSLVFKLEKVYLRLCFYIRFVDLAEHLTVVIHWLHV